jgi:hypothetical protein
MSAAASLPLPSVRRTVALAAVALLAAGCVGTGAGPSRPADPSAPASSSTPSVAPSDSQPTVGSLYLRAWESQALAPQYTFAWLPVLTIADAQVIDGNVAVPAIYPGPLWIDPSVRTISSRGIDAIVAEARKDGLLGDKSDFIDSPMPGAKMAHLSLILDGKTYELTGDPTALLRCMCTPAPATAGAFADFWQKLTGLQGWLTTELGASTPFEPESVAVLAAPPSDTPVDGITAQQKPWPLTTPFASFGSAMGSDTSRCGVVTGADLALLLPAVKSANALTRFVDVNGTGDALQVRVMVPNEPSPCA